MKTGIFRLGQCASVDKTRSPYLFVACEEIGQPLQLFAMLAENSTDVFTGRSAPEGSCSLPPSRMDSSVALQSRLELGKVDAKPIHYASS